MRHIRAYEGAPCQDTGFCTISMKVQKAQREMADILLSVRMLGMINPECLGSAKAHMQPHARCAEVCILVRCMMCSNRLYGRNTSGHHPPLLTRRMCIGNHWVRLRTAREPSHTDFAVTCSILIA